MDALVYIFAATFVILGIWVTGVMVSHYSLSDRAVRFAFMLNRLGLTFEKVKIAQSAAHLPTAAYLCMHCKDAKACDAWLAREVRRAGPPDFCLNSNFIKLLQKTAETAEAA